MAQCDRNYCDCRKHNRACVPQCHCNPTHCKNKPGVINELAEELADAKRAKYILMSQQLQQSEFDYAAERKKCKQLREINAKLLESNKKATRDRMDHKTTVIANRTLQAEVVKLKCDLAVQTHISEDLRSRSQVEFATDSSFGSDIFDDLILDPDLLGDITF